LPFLGAGYAAPGGDYGGRGFEEGELGGVLGVGESGGGVAGVTELGGVETEGTPGDRGEY